MTPELRGKHREKVSRELQVTAHQAQLPRGHHSWAVKALAVSWRSWASINLIQ